MQEGKTFEHIMDELRHTKLVVVSTYVMLLSFFYNLPVVTYSVKGSNELRLFDLAGLVIMIFYFRNFNLINSIISGLPVLRYLRQFLFLCNFLMIPTTINSILDDRPYWIFQSLLYLFHFWAFYIASIFLIILIQDLKHLRRIVIYLMVMACLTFFIVLLQNFGLVPFLWNNQYLRAYHGFLSGTLGPNKIVLGMTGLLVFTLCIGLVNEKRVSLPKWLLYVTIIMSLLGLGLSGSRTSYLGFGVFMAYFMWKQTGKFLSSTVVVAVLVVVTFSLSPKLVNKLDDIYQNRIEKKVRITRTASKAGADDLYEDLGSGRKELSMLYINYLYDNPYIIPLGIGFNNRLALTSSAHNMYLSLINEVGVVGSFMYFRWLFGYLFVQMPHFPSMRMALKGLTLSMLITLFFGEHLFIYRVLFGLLGLFLFITIILMAPIFITQDDDKPSSEPEPI